MNVKKQAMSDRGLMGVLWNDENNGVGASGRRARGSSM